MNMFRCFTAHIAGLPFPSRKRQTRNVKIGLKGIIESEHICDIGYLEHPVEDRLLFGEKKAETNLKVSSEIPGWGIRNLESPECS